MHTQREKARELAVQLVGHIRAKQPVAELAICPPSVWLEAVQAEIGDSFIALGAQDCSSAGDEGAHTGDVSAWMLADAGCAYVIVGHSERRTDYKETDAQVRAKAEQVIAHGMVPVICVGELAEHRDAGHEWAIVEKQLAESIPANQGETIVIAYEPVWAIGTGKVPTLEDIEVMHESIHTYVREQKGHDFALRVLYGGSVKPQNAAEILAIEGVDGALVGGASLDADSFIAISEAVK